MYIFLSCTFQGSSSVITMNTLHFELGRGLGVLLRPPFVSYMSLYICGSVKLCTDFKLMFYLLHLPEAHEIIIWIFA